MVTRSEAAHIGRSGGRCTHRDLASSATGANWECKADGAGSNPARCHRMKGESMRDLRFVLGHFLSRCRFVSFPHRCPGENCAIQRWIEDTNRRRHEAKMAAITVETEAKAC